MKVLHVIRGMANSSGTTHIVGPLAEAQARSGCEVSVFCVEKGNDAPVLPDPSLVESQCFKQTLPLNNPGVSAAFARAVGRRLREFDIVHVHAIWNFPSWWAMRSAYRAGVPYIVAPQGSLDPWALRQNARGKKLYGALTEVPLLQRAACLQGLTEKEAGQIRAFGIAARCEIIPNGIDERLMERGASPDPGQFGLANGCKTLLFLSRIHSKKGLDLLVNTAEMVRHEHASLRIVVAGGDAGSGYLDVIKSECEHKGLAGMFVFLGEVQGARKLEVLSAADAFVLPSYSEGLPVAALEALGAGLPVVLTDECNLPEVAESGAGYVVAPDATQLANAVTRLFTLPDAARREMGERGRELAAGKFTWRGIASRTLDCYREILDAGGIH